MSLAGLPSDPSQTRGPDLLAVAIVCLTLTCTLVALRCYVRLFLTKSWGLDDWFLIGSEIFYSAVCIDLIIGVHWGIGKHLPDIEPAHRPIAFKCWWLLEVFFAFGASLVRVSILIMLLRICRAKWQTRLLIGTTVIYLTYSAVWMLLVIFQCNPVSHVWKQVSGPQPGTCFEDHVITNTSAAQSALSACIDLIMALIPGILMKDLQLNRPSQISLLFIMGLGILACAVTIIRVTSAVDAVTFEGDALYDTANLVIWSVTEPGVGITACSLAAMRPLFGKFFRVGGSGTDGSGGYRSRHKSQISQSAAFRKRVAESRGQRLFGSGHFDEHADIEAHELSSSPSFEKGATRQTCASSCGPESEESLDIRSAPRWHYENGDF